MVGTATKYPFFYSFLAGVLSVIFVGALTFGFIFLWRYFRNRRRLEPSNNAIPLATLEGGLKASDASDDSGSSRSPSRLGGLSPSSVKRADEALETQSRFSAQSGRGNGPEDDGPRPVSGISEGSANVVNPLTAGVERFKDRTTGKRAEDGSELNFRGKNGNTTTEGVRPRARIPPLPAVPQAPAARLSISTVWSQESMWPRERRPDVPMPPLPHMPAVAHMAVPRRVMFSPSMGSGSQNRRSTSSLPRSVGQSDFEDYI
jgi:hypothetical protein